MRTTIIRQLTGLHSWNSRSLGRLAVILGLMFCAWVLMFSQPLLPEPSGFATNLAVQQEPIKQSCSAADLSCQEVAERDCSLPDACLSVIERPFLVHLSVCHSVAQTALAPPERPPRLRA